MRYNGPMEKRCETCGTSFPRRVGVRGRPPKHCPKCRVKKKAAPKMTREKFPPGPRKCAWCGEMMANPTVTQKCCSAKCRDKLRYHNPDLSKMTPCRDCGKPTTITRAKASPDGHQCSSCYAGGKPEECRGCGASMKGEPKTAAFCKTCRGSNMTHGTRGGALPRFCEENRQISDKRAGG